MYHHQKYDPKSFNLLNGAQVPFDISKLKSLQVLDGMEGGGMLIKQLGHMTQLTRLILTNVRDIDEEDLCNWYLLRQVTRMKCYAWMHCLHLLQLYFECVPNTLIEGIRTKGSSDHSKVKHVSDIVYLCGTDSGWSSERL
ncbi:hypothetical protein ACFX19_020085 [Malus domestica]